LTSAPPEAALEKRAAPESAGRATTWLVDGLILGCIVATLAALVWYCLRAWGPRVDVVEIDLDPRALPAYTLLSFVRVVLSYLLSLVYTVIWGTIAAKSRRAEKVMIPILDVLQGIPVLGFLPGVGLAMMALFPGSNVGIELTCILMIFTAMPWNMAYSYYSSLRSIPEELESVARLHRFTIWQRFTKLELPIALTGLVWNSMMSMAGGWFFLLILEVFPLRNFATGKVEQFLLPGIGSYMSEAYRTANWTAVGWALATMSVVVVLTDQLIWKPVVTWSQRFKLEEEGGQPLRSSWLDLLLARSRVRALWVESRRRARGPLPTTLAASVPAPLEPVLSPARQDQLKSFVGWSTALVSLGLAIWGGVKVAVLLEDVTLAKWGQILIALFWTTIRHFSAVVIGAVIMIPVGVLLGLSPKVARRAQPIVQVIASFPAPMFFPLVSIAIVRFLGGQAGFEWGCVLLTLFATQWYILFNVIAGATAIPLDLQEAALAYRTTGFARWKTLLLPGIVPYLVTGLFTSAGGAWNGAIVSEYQTLPNGTLQATGLGAMISASNDAGDYSTLAAAILVLTLMIIFLNRFLWTPLHRKSEERFSLN
jgi:NitT/TauT family transport system permease protein